MLCEENEAIAQEINGRKETAGEAPREVKRRLPELRSCTGVEY
jgi:hypothetical protein